MALQMHFLDPHHRLAVVCSSCRIAQRLSVATGDPGIRARRSFVLWMLPRLVLAVALVSLVSLGSASAAAITSGDLIVYRVGDGAATLGTTAAAVFLDEYTPEGAFVQSIMLPSSGADALTAVGTATSEGIISISQDGQRLLFTGYRKDVGGSNPSSDVPAVTNRVVASVGFSGDVSTALTFTGATLANEGSGTIRSATTVDGTSMYVSLSTGVRYVAAPSLGASSVQIDSRNSRQVNLEDNVLFASNGSTTVTAKVQSYGLLPTSATAATPVVTLLGPDAVNGFALFDLSPDILGVDTLYALSTVESLLRKYTFDGTSWFESGALSSAAQNLTGTLFGGGVNLFLTSPTTLSMISDSSGYNGFLFGGLTPLATASSGTAFRGIGSLQVPEPSFFGLVVIGLALRAGGRRARRS